MSRPGRARLRARRAERAGRAPWHLLGIATVVAPVLSLAVALPVAMADPARASAADRCGAAAVPAGQIRVAVVVDPGVEPGSPGGPSVECLVVPDSTTGAQILAQRADLLGRPRPRYAASGLLCAIDGYPSSGCGEHVGSTYRYWAAWDGSGGSWVYGSGNPFTRRAHDGDVIGWRFVAGSGTPSDPPPRVSADPATLFPAVTPPGDPAPEPSSTGGGGAGVAGASASARGESTDTPPGAGAADTGVAGTESQTAGGSDGVDSGATGPGTASDGSSSGAPGAATSEAATNATAVAGEEVAAAPTSSSSGVPVGALLGALTIAGLGGAATLRFRRREP